MQAIDDSERRPAHVEDQLALRALGDRYCDAVNRRDTAAWLDTWSDDPTWELFGRAQHGRDALRATFEQALAMLRFVVQTAVNPVLELDGERARGRWLVSEWSESEKLGRLQLVFFYHDEYVRVTDAWRFRSRRMQLLYQGPPDLSGRSFRAGPEVG